MIDIISQIIAGVFALAASLLGYFLSKNKKKYKKAHKKASDALEILKASNEQLKKEKDSQEKEHKKAIDALDASIESLKKENDNQEIVQEIMYSDWACNYREKILQATDCIFFSAIVLEVVSNMDVRKAFGEIDNRIMVNFFSIDDDAVIIKSANRYMGSDYDITRSMGSTNSDWIKTITKNHDRTDHDKLNTFVQTAYFAVDYKEICSTSFIQAKHYLLNDARGREGVYYITPRPGSELFMTYREQIMLIEKKKGKVGWVDSQK